MRVHSHLSLPAGKVVGHVFRYKAKRTISRPHNSSKLDRECFATTRPPSYDCVAQWPVASI
jgi:hypothetical protein